MFYWLSALVLDSPRWHFISLLYLTTSSHSCFIPLIILIDWSCFVFRDASVKFRLQLLKARTKSSSTRETNQITDMFFSSMYNLTNVILDYFEHRSRPRKGPKRRAMRRAWRSTLSTSPWRKASWKKPACFSDMSHKQILYFVSPLM